MQYLTEKCRSQITSDYLQNMTMTKIIQQG